MGKGQVWVNGHNIGRHWSAYTARGNCGRCNYAGIYNEKKCLSHCGEPSQRWLEEKKTTISFSCSSYLLKNLTHMIDLIMFQVPCASFMAKTVWEPSSYI